ncbi:hypothetical protein CLHOM_02360 [Clostridium homopropionicum DSM 5847]|uniref:Uncharacterized protein n=1 Tax=Clostridium homopropionicum DSM 5847 TaxID=1121318 RepID=A0A0L6ZEF3_9CLOT|nr:hypothetical protein [Clostridium homopropionicum]KOA21351.1 hypothetical protein CLHOM_02360 [Clostridium homopropionicum DSM 5847]SFG97893.1 hypothetical protein SAMN04488501_1302 [Clostridium homopropionicum]
MFRVIKAFVTVDNKTYSLNINVNDQEISYEGEPINISIINTSEKIIATINNNSDNDVNLNKIELDLFYLEAKSYSSFILNNENSQADIDLNIINSNALNQSYKSYLFTFLSAMDHYENIFLGFLSSHISRNYIKINVNRDKVTVSSVFDFVNHCLKSGEKLKLDEIYLDFNKQMIESFNIYGNLINSECFGKCKGFHEIYNEGELKTEESFHILFENEASEVSLVTNGKPYSIKLSGKNTYPIDISKIEGKSFVMNKLEDFSEKGHKSLYIKNVIPYINTVVQSKAFNPYYELSNLLTEIKREFNSILTFDDCPLGIAINNMNVIESSFELKPLKDESLLRLIKRKKNNHNLNYNLILKTILYGGLFLNNSKFIASNLKIIQAMDIVTQNINASSLDNKNMLNMILDINRNENSNLISHMEKENVFSILREGKNSNYIAIFNLTDKSARFYWDMSKGIDKNLDGSSVDILNNKNYLIVNNVIYIRNIPPMDCCLIVR